MDRANVAVRNFPMNAEDLKKKLRIGSGGDDHLYGCTLANGKKVLLHFKRLD